MIANSLQSTQYMAKARNIKKYIYALIFLVYLLLIFEGALRKWVFPQFEEFIFFIRAPVTILLYVVAIFGRSFPRPRPMLAIAYGFAFAAAAIGPLQLILGGYSAQHIILFGYGWYSYFFYIPLGFLIAEQTRWQDMHRLARLTLWFAILSAPLMAWQFFSQPNAAINAGFGLDDASFLGLRSAQGYIRPMGLFTAALGNQMFSLGALVFIAYAWLQSGLRRHIPTLLLWAASLASLVIIGLSQSRTLFFTSAAFILFAILATLVTRRERQLRRILFGLAALAFFFSVLWPTLLPTSYQVFIQRWQNAAASEAEIFEIGTAGRILYGLYSFTLYVEDTPTQGYLLGIGGNAANQLGWVQKPAAYYEWNGYGEWAEQAWDNHIIEMGPFLGVAFILYRLLLFFWLGSLSLVRSYQTHNPLSLLFFGYTSLLFIFGHMTSQGTVTGFFWIFFGLNLAACRLATRELTT
jgi:hypothetical protein